MNKFLLFYLIFGPSYLVAQTLGCTDPLATNYDAMANQNDGFCVYASVMLTPDLQGPLPSVLSESSGLMFWQNQYWSHNDDSDLTLYAFDDSARLQQQIDLSTWSLSNLDWEELQQDSEYVYIGDFGNNAQGNRQDLCIYRLSKRALLGLDSAAVDSIRFAYEDQTDFSAQAANSSNFDCEAFVVQGDSIYLFTKRWTGGGTHCYALPKVAGQHLARWRDSLDTQGGMITGASWVEAQGLLVLSGYSQYLQPFLYLCYDFVGTNFFAGNKRRLGLNLSLSQVEGLHSVDGQTVYFTTETWGSGSAQRPARLYRLDFAAYWQAPTALQQMALPRLLPWPNPAQNYLKMAWAQGSERPVWQLFDAKGSLHRPVCWAEGRAWHWNLEGLPAGWYVLQVAGQQSVIWEKR